jgi:predicted NACHT family NTPase
MTAILNRTQPLPRNRVELYEQASRVLLYEWDASRFLPGDTFARQEKGELLRELAGAMQKGEGSLAGNVIDRASLIGIFRNFLQQLSVQEPYAKAASLVNQLTERNFILCYAGADRFSFVHRTFLEYFCAAWFVDLFEKKQTPTLEQLTKTRGFRKALERGNLARGAAPDCRHGWREESPKNSSNL